MFGALGYDGVLPCEHKSVVGLDCKQLSVVCGQSSHSIILFCRLARCINVFEN